MLQSDLSNLEQMQSYSYLYDRRLPQIPRFVLAGIKDTSFQSSAALPLENLNDLLSNRQLELENGCCEMEDGCIFVAVETPFPNITKDMLNWWFTWHPEDSLRYKIWYPGAHISIRMTRTQEQQPGDLPYWHTTHYPTENIGTGKEEISIHFLPPQTFGFDPALFDQAGVETIICGYVGSPNRKLVEHTRMCHVLLKSENGPVLKSRFWLGHTIVFNPFWGSKLLGRLANTKIARRNLLPTDAGVHMALHCAQEYNNLAQILPGLYALYGPR